MLLFSEREVEDHEEVELLLEGYRSDLQEMQLELKSMREQIDDTREFINTHQVIPISVFRNKFVTEWHTYSTQPNITSS